ncbi:TPA: N-acetyltransferase family protein [Salmonella enterica]
MKIVFVTKPTSPYGRKYYADLLSLHNKLYADQRIKLTDLNGRDGFASIDKLEEIWNEGTMCACAVDDRDVVVGFITFGYTKKGQRWLWIYNFFVEEEVRSQGVGKDLIAAVEAYGKSKGCAWMQLTVLGNNDRALAFYERFGFRTEYHDMVKEI